MKGKGDGGEKKPSEGVMTMQSDPVKIIASTTSWSWKKSIIRGVLENINVFRTLDMGF